MIASDAQAIAVQKRRFNAGKRGTAKSIRRYIKRVYDVPAFALITRCSFTDAISKHLTFEIKKVEPEPD